jgi:hypothetical protein
MEFIWLFLTPLSVRIFEVRKLAGWWFSPEIAAIEAMLSGLSPRN